MATEQAMSRHIVSLYLPGISSAENVASSTARVLVVGAV